MLAINAFQQRDDGIFVEQKPQAQPQHERSENLEFKGSFNLRLLTNTKCIKFALTKKMKLNRQRMYFAQHDPTSWPILEFWLYQLRVESFEGRAMQLGLIAGDFGGAAGLSRPIPNDAAFEFGEKFKNTTVSLGSALASVTTSEHLSGDFVEGGVVVCDANLQIDARDELTDLFEWLLGAGETLKTFRLSGSWHGFNLCKFWERDGQKVNTLVKVNSTETPLDNKCCDDLIERWTVLFYFRKTPTAKRSRYEIRGAKNWHFGSFLLRFIKV